MKFNIEVEASIEADRIETAAVVIGQALSALHFEIPIAFQSIVIDKCNEEEC